MVTILDERAIGHDGRRRDDRGVAFWEARDGFFLGLARTGDGRLLVVSEPQSGGDGVEVRAFTESGALDPAFGTGGVVTGGGSSREPRGLELDPAGNIYVLSRDGSDGSLTRYGPSGAFDPSFTTAAFDVEVFDVAVSGDGATILIGAEGRVYALDASGAPVTTFGTDGVLDLGGAEAAEISWIDASEFLVVEALSAEFPRQFPRSIQRFALDGASSPFDTPAAAARMATFAAPILRDGVVYLPGVTRSLDPAPFGPNELETSILAMDASGAPLTAFGEDGLAVAGSGRGTLIIWDMEREVDGAVRVLGMAGNQSVTMRAAAGTFDSAYGDSGIASSRPVLQLFTIEADGAGRIVGATNGGPVRYLADGSIDEAFGDSGFARPPPPVFLMPGIAIDGDDRVHGVGLSASQDVMVARFDEAGTPDASFGTGGVVTIPATTFGDPMGQTTPWGIYVEDDGDVLITAEGIRVTDRFLDVFTAARLDSDGNLDSSFGTGGVLTIEDAEIRRHRIIAREAGGYFVAGYPRLCGGAEPCTVQVVAFDDAGQADAAFGAGGVAAIEMHGNGLYGFFVGLAEHDGGVLISGAVDAGRTEQLAVWRLGADGQLDTSFGAGGRFTLAGEGRATSIVPDGDGYLVGGWRFDPDTGTDPIIVRLAL